MAASKQDAAKGGNFGVDFVINYSAPPKEQAEAEAGYIELIKALTKAGLATEVRPGNKHHLLVFIRIASTELLAQQVYRSRLQDWLHGVRSSSPETDVAKALESEPVTEAERLRLVYQMITKPANEGGAGVAEASGKWQYVKAIFPLHDKHFNSEWVKKWNSKYSVTDADLEEIRCKFGENVTFYFVFLRSYFRFLAFPAALGVVAWMFLGQFSMTYSLGLSLWTVVFFEYWKKKEVDLAVQWGVRHVSKIQHARPEFKWDYETEDEVTGEPIRVYSPVKRLQSQILQVPFALACVVALGSLSVTAISLEIFINQVYAGPGKQYLGFLPTVILVVCTPILSTILMGLATLLNNAENYATVDAHDAALVRKQFVLNFMTSYMPLLFTAFVYIPFGQVLMPILNLWRQAAFAVTFNKVPLPTHRFEIDPARIANQMYYFTVTAQIVNFATELVVPYIKQRAFAKAKEIQEKHSSHPDVLDHPEEEALLKQAREECDMGEYDVTDDYREMVMQYGYMSLFSVAWPLASVCFFVNNFVELRSDAMKIATSERRPIPWRADSIGPWLHTIGLLSWLGSVTSSAIVYLCSNSRNGQGFQGGAAAWGLLLSIIFAEHFYFLTQFVVRLVMDSFESTGLQQVRKARFDMKRQHLQDTLGHDAAEVATASGIETSEKITRKALEDEARLASSSGHSSPAETFWQRQRGMQDTIDVGRYHLQQQLEQASKGASSSSAAKQAPQAPAPSPRA